MDISSSEDNRSSDSEDDTAVSKRSPLVEPPSLEQEQKTDINGDVFFFWLKPKKVIAVLRGQWKRETGE